MPKVPEEIKNAIEMLEKYWFKLESHGEWQQLSIEGLPYSLEAYEFKLKPPEPLILERISAFEKAYTPRISMSGEAMAITIYDRGYMKKLAPKNLLFATGSDATKVAQKWIDEASKIDY